MPNSTIRTVLVFAATVLVGASPARSDVIIWDEDLAWINFMQHQAIKVMIDDQVDDGCWTSLRATKSGVELELIRSGFKVVDEDDGTFSPTIYLKAVGFSTKNKINCVVSYGILVTVAEIDSRAQEELDSKFTSVFYRDLYRTNGVGISAKSEMSTELKGIFVDEIKGFLVQIEKRRNAFIAKISEGKSPDKDEWIQYINSLKIEAQ